MNCIIHQPVCPVSKLQGFQQGSCDVPQVSQPQSLQGFQDYRRQGDRSFNPDGYFLGDRDDGGAFEAGGNLTQLKRSVEDLLKICVKIRDSWSVQVVSHVGDI